MTETGKFTPEVPWTGSLPIYSARPSKEISIGFFRFLCYPSLVVTSLVVMNGRRSLIREALSSPIRRLGRDVSEPGMNNDDRFFKGGKK